MDEFICAEPQEVHRPITSLISKSEKALQKLAPGTWQHRMLGDNLRALHIALTLMAKQGRETDHFTRHDLEEALGALARMISRTDDARSKFSPGASQHTLLRNRLRALRVAEAGIEMRLRSHKTPNRRCSEPRYSVTSMSFVLAIHTSCFMESFTGLAVPDLESR